MFYFYIFSFKVFLFLVLIIFLIIKIYYFNNLKLVFMVKKMLIDVININYLSYEKVYVSYNILKWMKIKYIYKS